MDHLEHCDALARELQQFQQDLAGADLATAVPTCPRWDVLKLIAHLGGVHRWCEAMVREVAQERLERRTPKPGPDQMVAWFAEGGELLLATLLAAEPNEPMFAWGTDQHVRFWSRRQLHETAVHRFDVCNALGRDFTMEPAVARDSIDEFLDNLAKSVYFAPNVEKLKGNGEVIHLHATDAEGEWIIRMNSDGFSYEHAHAKGEVAVQAPISDLALMMWGRRDPSGERFKVFGDDARLRFWLANSAL